MIDFKLKIIQNRMLHGMTLIDIHKQPFLIVYRRKVNPPICLICRQICIKKASEFLFVKCIFSLVRLYYDSLILSLQPSFSLTNFMCFVLEISMCQLFIAMFQSIIELCQMRSELLNLNAPFLPKNNPFVST